MNDGKLIEQAALDHVVTEQTKVAGKHGGDCCCATCELNEAEWGIRAKGQQFFFLPMFGFASPDDIPSRPIDYGVVT